MASNGVDFEALEQFLVSEAPGYGRAIQDFLGQLRRDGWDEQRIQQAGDVLYNALADMAERAAYGGTTIAERTLRSLRTLRGL